MCKNDYLLNLILVEVIRILNTDLYGITAEKYSKGRNNIEVVKEMIAAGIRIIQYREKNKSMSGKFEECKQIRKMTAAAGVNFIVNDHVDLAMMVEADGVHLGQKDLPVAEVRKILGQDYIIGLSTHSPGQALEAVEKDIDYIGVGPIFKTDTKDDVCDPVGFKYLDYVVNNIELPFVAIGGIKEHNIDIISKRGAECICLVTEIVGADDIQKKIRNLRRKI